MRQGQRQDQRNKMPAARGNEMARETFDLLGWFCAKRMIELSPAKTRT
jgi:hypothetical protein